jgi:predicted metalloprotease with PDZ domain
MRTLAVFLLFGILVSSVALADPQPIALAVDLSEAPRRIFHVHETIPVSSSSLELFYPKWIPGEHGPTGPIVNLANLRVKSGRDSLAWTRDPADVYRIRVAVPKAASSVELDFDYLAPASADGFSSSASTSPSLAVLEWNVALLYPSGRAPREQRFAASLKLPAGWKLGTALAIAKQSGDSTSFQAVSLETLIDSPVLAGAFLRKVDLGSGDEVVVAGDTVASIEAKTETVAGWRKLVEEAQKLFGAKHYLHYHFLLALSEGVGHFGLEHHESSDDRGPERMLTDDEQRQSWATLLPHEYVHSWNGKYRRPKDLTTPDYQQPMHGDLLWVYEGLTNYLGWVLAARSGLLPHDWATDELAMMAAVLDHRVGRAWRPLADTAVAAQLLYGAPSEWASLRRSTDFYSEGTLLWLEADVIIRQRSKGARSLDDFCKKFHGGASGAPTVSTYTLDDVTATLDQVEKYDWAGFFKSRVYGVAPHPPLAGIESGGWKLAYNDKANLDWTAIEKSEKVLFFDTSIGLRLKEDGTFLDVTPGMPAALAGLAPGMKLVGVNNRKWNPQLLHEAVKSGDPIELLVENAEFYRVGHLKHKAGERYPHLERSSDKPDLLSEILHQSPPKVADQR